MLNITGRTPVTCRPCAGHFTLSVLSGTCRWTCQASYSHPLIHQVKPAEDPYVVCLSCCFPVSYFHWLSAPAASNSVIVLPSWPSLRVTPTFEGQVDVLSCLCPSVGAQVERHHLMRAPLGFQPLAERWSCSRWSICHLCCGGCASISFLCGARGALRDVLGKARD